MNKQCNGKTVHALTVVWFQRGHQSDMICYPVLKEGNGDMATAEDISVLYQEFAEALTEVLAENSVGLARRGRLARARAAVKKHPKYTEHEYFLAVETAFARWELIQNMGRVDANAVTRPHRRVAFRGPPSSHSTFWTR